MIDINDFISFVKCCYRTSFKEPLLFPNYSELKDEHHHYVLNATEEARMFNIADNLNALYSLAHINYLRKYDLFPSLDVLIQKYQYEDMNIVDPKLKKLNYLLNHYIDIELIELVDFNQLKDKSYQKSISDIGKLIRLKRDGTNQEKLLKLIDYLVEIEDSECLKYTKLRLNWENENGNE